MKIRLIGSFEELAIAFYRLRDAFDEVECGQPVPSRAEPGKWRVYCIVRRF